MRPRNILFASVLCMLLCGPALIGLASWSGVALPSWLTADDAAYLSGGIVEADPAAYASLEGFSSGEFQIAAEDAVGNCIPMKAMALLANAALQRSAIEASNALFGWECYPAFYGSSIAEMPSRHRLLEIAEKATGDTLATASHIRDGLDALSLRHPEQRFFVYMGPDSMNIEGSPTAKLISNPLTYGELSSIFEDEDGHFQWIDGNVTFDEFADGWNSTDHHWNIQGAFRAYERMASALGFRDELLVPAHLVTYDAPSFRGTFARRGLETRYVDQMTDYEFADFPQLSITIDGAEASMDSLVHWKNYQAANVGANAFTSRYAEYFHTDYGLITLENEESDSRQDLLIVADSYSNCMERFLAVHYRTTYVLDPRHDDETIDAFLAQHQDVSDVLFIMRSPNMLAQTTEHALEPEDMRE